MVKPKMNLVGEDGNIYSILGRASKLLRQADQEDRVEEMVKRVTSSHSYYEALCIVSEYVETELSEATRRNQIETEKQKGGDAR